MVTRGGGLHSSSPAVQAQVTLITEKAEGGGGGEGYSCLEYEEIQQGGGRIVAHCTAVEQPVIHILHTVIYSHSPENNLSIINWQSL